MNISCHTHVDGDAQPLPCDIFYVLVIAYNEYICKYVIYVENVWANTFVFLNTRTYNSRNIIKAILYRYLDCEPVPSDSAGGEASIFCCVGLQCLETKYIVYWTIKQFIRQYNYVMWSLNPRKACMHWVVVVTIFYRKTSNLYK